MVFNNKDYDSSGLNINELKFLENHHLANDLIHHPFNLNSELKLINPNLERPDKAEKLVYDMMKNLKKGLKTEAEYLKKEVAMLMEFKLSNVPMGLVQFSFTSQQIFQQMNKKGCKTSEEEFDLTYKTFDEKIENVTKLLDRQEKKDWSQIPLVCMKIYSESSWISSRIDEISWLNPYNKNSG